MDIFGTISAALTAAPRAEGTQGELPPPCKQQGAAGRLRAGQDPGASPPLREQGQQGAAGCAVLQAQGQPEAAALGQGGQGHGGPPLPPVRRSPPPPPSLRGRAGQPQVRSNATRGGRAASGADRQRRPSQHRGVAARMPARGGGLLSLGLTRQVQPSGHPTPHSRTCRRGRGSAQPEIWAGSLLGGSHEGGRPRSFRRAAIHLGGGAGGVRALYICIQQLYIDELSPANPLIPSIALASRT